jgi:hypothetical protein
VFVFGYMYLLVLASRDTMSWCLVVVNQALHVRDVCLVICVQMCSQARTILKALWTRLCRHKQIGRISVARLPPAWLMQPGYREKPTKQAVRVPVFLRDLLAKSAGLTRESTCNGSRPTLYIDEGLQPIEPPQLIQSNLLIAFTF